MTNILITTTPTVENRPVREYLGIVSGEAFMDERRIRFRSGYYRLFDRRILEYRIDVIDKVRRILEHRIDLIDRYYRYYSNSRKLLSKRVYSDLMSISQRTAYILWRICEGFWELKAEFHKAQKRAIREMAEEAAKLGANAVIGVKIDYKTPGGFSGYYDSSSFSMYAESVWVIATGTAVRL
jgi:uncharacterized protein YbjQ (UPF0145 family)